MSHSVEEIIKQKVRIIRPTFFARTRARHCVYIRSISAGTGIADMYTVSSQNMPKKKRK